MRDRLFALLSVLLVVIAAAFLNKAFFTVAVAALMIVGTWEFFSMSKFREKQLPVWISTLAIIAIFSANQFLDLGALVNNPFSLFIVVLFVSVFIMELVLKQFFFADSELATIGRAILLFGFFGIFVVHIRNIDDTAQLYVMWLLMLVVANELFAYIAHELFGKKRVQNKDEGYDRSIEGAVGAVVGNILAIVPLGLVWTKFPVWMLMVMVLLASLAMLLGNLHRDLVKRTFLTQKARPLVPAFGTVYDRLSAFIFLTPLAYYTVSAATWSLHF